jgi:SAM-dependent methyltransferase
MGGGGVSAAQAEYWNATAGPVWVEFQADLDRQVAPLGAAALAALAPAPGERVLDIGCGCGATTLALAAAVGPAGAVTGIDLSEPMLAVAQAREVPPAAAPPRFLLGDAESDDLGSAAFDAAFSRFGVMFFADPPRAFANIRRALRSGGRLAFVCWRSLAENPILRAPVEAALPLLAALPPPDPTAPGPFALADAGRTRAILDAAGFTTVQIDPFDAPVGGASLGRAVELGLNVGPLGAALREQPGRREAVTAAVREALAPYETATGVLLPAAVWVVTAVVP